MKRIICAAIVLGLISGAAWAMHHAWVGGAGIGPFGSEIAGGLATTVVLVPCTSTGIYDLSNVCNDIYFIGALK